MNFSCPFKIFFKVTFSQHDCYVTENPITIFGVHMENELGKYEIRITKSCAFENVAESFFFLRINKWKIEASTARVDYKNP